MTDDTVERIAMREIISKAIMDPANMPDGNGVHMPARQAYSVADAILSAMPQQEVTVKVREWLAKQPDIDFLGECYQPRFLMNALDVYTAALSGQDAEEYPNGL